MTSRPMIPATVTPDPIPRNPAPRIDPRLKRQLQAERNERRYLAGLAYTWALCPRQACRRARACRDRHAACFYEQFDEIESTVEGLLYRDAFEEVRDEDLAAEYRALRTASKV